MKIFKTLFFLCLVFVSCSSHAQDDHELQKLLAPFSETQHLKIAYEEKRYSLFFKQARVYQGYIEYLSPNTFIKFVQSPQKKKIIIVDDQLSLYSYDSSDTALKKEVSLNDFPQFKQLNALFSGLFKGQASELTQYFRYEIHPSEGQKTRLLLRSLVNDAFTETEQQKTHTDKKIEIIFQGERISQIIMTGLGGERSELLFKEIMIKTLINE